MCPPLLRRVSGKAAMQEVCKPANILICVAVPLEIEQDMRVVNAIKAFSRTHFTNFDECDQDLYRFRLSKRSNEWSSTMNGGEMSQSLDRWWIDNYASVLKPEHATAPVVSDNIHYHRKCFVICDTHSSQGSEFNYLHRCALLFYQRCCLLISPPVQR